MGRNCAHNSRVQCSHFIVLDAKWNHAIASYPSLVCSWVASIQVRPSTGGRSSISRKSSKERSESTTTNYRLGNQPTKHCVVKTWMRYVDERRREAQYSVSVWTFRRSRRR
ncbi:uncharacterized protein LOC143182895 [Calliopsis andreniformis]|uniref:uncharacterized protein LOC143182895 n=1 Tax=Calliopsis andreniformis TaxID=337506 RepID=UPI003FCE0F06